MADKPAEADEAQAYEANDAEADEADVADEATETDEADAIDEEIGAADDSIMIDEVVCGLQINEIGAAIESDESDVADEVDEADKSDKADEVDEAGVSIEMPLLLPFSLTKYSAFFMEVKGSFGINNNQL